MSKERELLEKILNTGWLNHELSCEVEAILAQPEQEPVAWLHEWVDETGETVRSIYHNFYEDENLIPLYTTPPKLERINHDDILDRSIDGSFEYRDGFMDGVMFAENHHGIGGGE